MANKKRPMGFETPSMRIQEEYKEILKQITAKKADWEKVLAECNNRYKYSNAMVETFLKKYESKEKTHEALMELEHGVSLWAISLTQLMIARVGKELAECDVRISEVEKELKESRRGIK